MKSLPSPVRLGLEGDRSGRDPRRAGLLPRGEVHGHGDYVALARTAARGIGVRNECQQSGWRGLMVRISHMRGSVLPTASELELQKHSLKVQPRKVLSHERGTVEMSPEMLTSVLFDQACLRFGKKNLWIATTLGVSESLVSRWRNPDHREGPSLAQVIALGEEFQRAFKKEQEKYHGWGRKALMDVIEAVGELAEAVGE